MVKYDCISFLSSSQQQQQQLSLLSQASRGRLEILLGFISIRVAKFLRWLAKPTTTLLLYQGSKYVKWKSQ
jgi:hypothetical protein